MCIDIMGEYVKGNLPPLTFSFFFNLFTLPKCLSVRATDPPMVISKCTNVFKIATFGNIYVYVRRNHGLKIIAHK